MSSGRNGYQLLPDGLLRNQRRLGLNCTDMVVLVNILMHWWEQTPEKMPHPRPEQIAKRIGASARTVQRSINRLSKVGLVKWLKPRPNEDGLSVRPFDIRGLVNALQRFANEVEAPQEDAM